MKTFTQFNESIIVWHGSPHDFGEFSIEKIGTGEGNATYGWGLYFTSSKIVGQAYQKNLYDYSHVDWANKRMSELSKEIDKYRTGVYGKFNDPRGYELAKEYDEVLQSKFKPKFLYNVELMIKDDKLLNYDSSLDDQSPYILRKLQVIKNQYPDVFDEAYNEGWGNSLYTTLTYHLGSPKQASLYLLSKGIPGLTYIGLESIVRNYVIFNKKIVRIREKTWEQ